MPYRETAVQIANFQRAGGFLVATNRFPISHQHPAMHLLGRWLADHGLDAFSRPIHFAKERVLQAA
jgi:hypothetical protein